MVDIHCHLLPGIDDGAKSWEISVAMCNMALADGIDHIVATPHANSEYAYDRVQFAAMLDRLRQQVDGVELTLGCDFHLSYDNLVELFAEPNRFTVGDSNYVLVELSDFSVPPSVTHSLEKLLSNRLVPIITHPERNPILQRDLNRVLSWVSLGCKVQVTADALTGSWGDLPKRAAIWLLQRGAVHVLATDAHGVHSRLPILSQARYTASFIIGEEAAHALVEVNPRAIVSAQALPQTIIQNRGLP